MKIVKCFLLISYLIVGINNSTYAQGILSPEQQEQVAQNVSNFLQNLNLSERDKPAFKEIMRDFFVGLVALRATDFPLATNKKIAKALIKGRDTRVKNLLSSDQYKVYKARAKERRANLKEFME